MTYQPPQPPVPPQPPAPPPPPFGAPQPIKKKPNVLLLVLVGVGALVLLCCGGGTIIAATAPDDKKSTADDQVASQDPAPTTPATAGDAGPTKPVATKPAKPSGPGIGQPARDGKFEFVVNKITCGKRSVGVAPFDAKAQGQFCLIKVSVKNIGDEPRSFTGGNQRAFSSAGAQFTNSTEAEMYANTDAETFLNEINPGNKVNGTLVFDVPKGTKLTKIELHDSMFSGGVTVRLS